MPRVCLGTYPFRGKEVYSLIKTAYDLGYRSFDTAWLYKNEIEIGRVIKDLGIHREEIFLTSKLHINNLFWPRYYYSYGGLKCKSVSQAYDDSCKRLGVDYLDLYLIHWPFPGYQKMWGELTKIYKANRVKAVGVSSFMPWHLESLRNISPLAPMVNQIEMNPYNAQAEVCTYCKNHGIRIAAYSPMGSGKFTKELLSDPVLLSVANNHRVSVAQVILRWMIQKQVIVIPRTNKEEKMRQNISLFNFELSDSEMQMVDNLNCNLFLEGDSRRVGEDGHYQKTRLC